MDSLAIYEESSAIAALLPADQRERFAAFLVEMTASLKPGPSVARHAAVRTWARDAGHLPRS